MSYARQRPKGGRRRRPPLESLDASVAPLEHRTARPRFASPPPTGGLARRLLTDFRGDRKRRKAAQPANENRHTRRLDSRQHQPARPTTTCDRQHPQPQRRRSQPSHIPRRTPAGHNARTGPGTPRSPNRAHTQAHAREAGRDAQPKPKAGSNNIGKTDLTDSGRLENRI